MEDQTTPNPNAIKIEVVIFEDALAWLNENMKDMTIDHVASVIPRQAFNPESTTRYLDKSEGKSKLCTVEDHIDALRLLATLIENKKLFVGGLKSAYELVDLANWDVEVTDAFYQLIFYKEVIYG